MLAEGLSNLSDTSKNFSIPNLKTAIAYLEHQELGKNLINDLTKLKRIFGFSDITEFFKNNPKDDIPKFISCILLFYVAKKSRPNLFNTAKYRIFDLILINLLDKQYQNDSHKKHQNLDNLSKNLTIKTIFKDYQNLNSIRTKDDLDKHIKIFLQRPSS